MDRPNETSHPQEIPEEQEPDLYVPFMNCVYAPPEFFFPQSDPGTDPDETVYPQRYADSSHGPVKKP